MKLLWQIYYKINLGNSYNSKLDLAKKLLDNTVQSTKPKINHFYNSDGEMIRGWQKTHYKFKNLPEKHPLELKYPRY